MAEDRMLNDEILLGLIKANSGGGGGGTTDYEDLNNLPKINSVELKGNKSLSDLGIASATDLANKVDKVAGKVLSTNDFTDAYKTAIGENTTAINAIKDGQSIDSFADVETALESKQDTLTFDDTPTDNSNNPVKSNGVYDALALKQNATDNNLTTTSKTVVGAVNELKSGLTNLDNEVNGDATTYDYADVITINDAVPANLADCSVKVEPVQDLHGYDKPWVGGAGKNKAESYYVNQVTNQYSPVLYIEGDLQPSTTYVVSFNSSSGNRYYANENLFADTTSFLTDDGRNSIVVTTKSTIGKSSSSQYTSGIGWIIIKNSITEPSTPTFSEVQLEINSAATSYEPYSNICPITGHTESVVTRDGKNLLEDIEEGGIDDYGEESLSFQRCRSNDYIKVYPNTQYTFFADTNQSKTLQYIIRSFKDNNNSYKLSDSTWQTGSYTFTTDSDCHYIKIIFGFSDNSNISKSYITNAQLELGSTATPYAPYAGKTYTLALGDTIYGGTVDFDSGVMTVTHGIVDMGQYNYSVTDIDNQYFTTISNRYKAPASLSDKPNWMCDSYDVGLPTYTNSRPLSNYTIGCFSDFSQNNIVFVRDPSCSSTAEMKTALNGVYLCYELATPLTVQLTPQQIQLLKGTNTLTASTGQISVTVNGVSGAIGAVQEQVNGLAEDVAEIKPLNYSTTEQKTGQKWIDGKDIYIKTISLAETDFTKTNNWFWQKDIESLITGYETIVKIFGAAIIEFDGSKHLLPFGSELYNVNNSDKCIKFANYYRNIIIKGTPYNDSDINFATKNLAIVKCNITVAYTKTNT